MASTQVWHLIKKSPIKIIVLSLGHLSKFVWLTVINLYIQVAYNFFAFLYAVLKLRMNSRVMELFGKFATVIVYPLSITVVALFWILMFINEDHVMEERDKIILNMPWFNHTLHTLPALMVFVDIANWKYRRPRYLTAIFTIVLFFSSYLIWIHYIAYTYGFWAYPILKNLDFLHRSLFIVECIGVFFLAFFLSDLFNLFVQSVTGKASNNGKRQKKTKSN